MICHVNDHYILTRVKRGRSVDPLQLIVKLFNILHSIRRAAHNGDSAPLKTFSVLAGRIELSHLHVRPPPTVCREDTALRS